MSGKIAEIFIKDSAGVNAPNDVIKYYSSGLLIIIAALIHVALFLYFLYFSVVFLAYYNLFAFTLVLLSFLTNRRGYCDASLLVVACEIIFCSILLTVSFGWASCFQWFMVFNLIPYYLFLEVSIKQKFFITAVSVLSMYFVFYTAYINPLWLIPNYVNIDFLTLVNLTCLFLVFYIEIKMNDTIKVYMHNAHEKYIHTLKQAAQRDALTNLWNRRYAELYFEKEIADGKGFSIALIDIDNFKNINDTYGHEVGDEVLIQFSRLLEQNLRSTDAIIRWGGEEFMVCLNLANTEIAFKLLEKIRSIAENKTYHISGNDIKFTITAGIAQYDKSKKMDDIIKESDACLYFGKEHGRNKVVTKQFIKYYKENH